MRISDWISDVCSSDLLVLLGKPAPRCVVDQTPFEETHRCPQERNQSATHNHTGSDPVEATEGGYRPFTPLSGGRIHEQAVVGFLVEPLLKVPQRSGEHTSGLQSLMRKSYAACCVKQTNLKQK